MADVTPDDVVLVTSRANDPVTINLIHVGQRDPADPRGRKAPILKNGAARLVAPEVRATAVVNLKGAPGDDVSLWRFGFIQLKFITDEWAHYRGVTETDGSMFLALDRPPARPQQLCRDSNGTIGRFERFPFLGSPVFFGAETVLSPLAPIGRRANGFLPLNTKIPAGGAMLITILFGDSPERFHELTKDNPQFTPPRNNILYSLYSGSAYATMFAVQKGPGTPIVVMKSFQWNVRWRAHFRTDAAGFLQQVPGRGDVLDVNISHVVTGPPNDPRFQNSILDTNLPNCVAVIQEAFADRRAMHTSKKWEDWDVTH
jgi:hypothetical protein